MRCLRAATKPIQTCRNHLKTSGPEEVLEIASPRSSIGIGLELQRRHPFVVSIFVNRFRDWTQSKVDLLSSVIEKAERGRCGRGLRRMTKWIVPDTANPTPSRQPNCMTRFTTCLQTLIGGHSRARFAIDTNRGAISRSARPETQRTIAARIAELEG